MWPKRRRRKSEARGTGRLGGNRRRRGGRGNEGRVLLVLRGSASEGGEGEFLRRHVQGSPVENADQPEGKEEERRHVGRGPCGEAARGAGRDKIVPTKPGPRDWSPRGQIPGMPIWPKFVDAYLEAALWSSMDDEGVPFDRDYDISDFDQESINKAVKESNEFIMANREDLEKVGNEEQHGHDFWLTRNGHGVGFWDRGYGEVGERLSEAADAYGEQHVWAGPNGTVYLE